MSTRELGIEAYPQNEHSEDKFVVRNVLWTIATVAICGFGYYARFCM